jgi:hypothetical protein
LTHPNTSIQYHDPTKQSTPHGKMAPEMGPGLLGVSAKKEDAIPTHHCLAKCSTEPSGIKAENGKITNEPKVNHHEM